MEDWVGPSYERTAAWFPVIVGGYRRTDGDSGSLSSNCIGPSKTALWIKVIYFENGCAYQLLDKRLNSCFLLNLLLLLF